MPKATCESVPVRHSSFELRHSFRISSRLEPGRAFSFSRRAGDGNVAELAVVDGATQQQTATTHVAAADEIGGETESRSEMFQKDIDILGGGDAAEEDDLTFARQSFRQSFHITLERIAIPRIVFVNLYAGELLKIRQADRRLCWNQAVRGRDDEDG
jgi:hypothetical protein